MQKRTYIITGVDGPGEDGVVTIRAKDFLSVVEERKAQVPIASPGQLKVDIGATQTSLSLVGALTSDYDNPGLVRVEDEFMRVTNIVAGAEDSVVLTVTRGALDSTATTHSAEEKVQNCFEWTGKNVTDTVEELLTNHANIAAAKVDTAGTFATEAEYLAPGSVDIVSSTSTSVFEILSNLQRQFGFYIWWDERDALVKLRVLRGLSQDDTTPVTLTDDNHFIAGTFKITDMPDRRVSQVWYHYDPRNDWEDGDKEALYKEILVYSDLASEGADQNGSQSILKILARFTDSQAIALSTASKIVVRYRDVPRKATFRLDAKDRSISVGDIVIISHYLDIDEQGNRNETRWLVTEMEEVKPGEEVRYAVDDVTSAGTVTKVMAAAAGDYNSSTSTQFETFIGDADGLLSDGTPCGRVSA